MSSKRSASSAAPKRGAKKSKMYSDDDESDGGAVAAPLPLPSAPRARPSRAAATAAKAALAAAAAAAASRDDDSDEDERSSGRGGSESGEDEGDDSEFDAQEAAAASDDDEDDGGDESEASEGQGSDVDASDDEASDDGSERAQRRERAYYLAMYKAYPLPPAGLPAEAVQNSGQATLQEQQAAGALEAAQDVGWRVPTDILDGLRAQEAWLLAPPTQALGLWIQDKRMTPPEFRPIAALQQRVRDAAERGTRVAADAADGERLLEARREQWRAEGMLYAATSWKPQPHVIAEWTYADAALKDLVPEAGALVAGLASGKAVAAAVAAAAAAAVPQAVEAAPQAAAAAVPETFAQQLLAAVGLYRAFLGEMRTLHRLRLRQVFVRLDIAADRGVVATFSIRRHTRDLNGWVETWSRYEQKYELPCSDDGARRGLPVHIDGLPAAQQMVKRRDEAPDAAETAAPHLARFAATVARDFVVSADGGIAALCAKDKATTPKGARANSFFQDWLLLEPQELCVPLSAPELLDQMRKAALGAVRADAPSATLEDVLPLMRVQHRVATPVKRAAPRTLFALVGFVHFDAARNAVRVMPSQAAVTVTLALAWSRGVPPIRLKKRGMMQIFPLHKAKGKHRIEGAALRELL